MAVVSPDGTRIVFAYKKGGHELLYSRRLDEADARPIAGTEGGERQAFSPDGGTIVFNAGGLLKTISLEGGPELDLVNSGFGTAAWAPDKTIIYTPNYTMGLWKMPSARGTPVKLTEPAAKDGELGHFWPQILPDGKTVLFTSFRTPDDRSRIEVYSLHTGQRKVIVDGGFFGQYVPTGHLLFARAGNVMAVRFDPVKLETIGESVPVIADIAFTPGNGVAQFSVSPTGTLAFMRQEALSSPRQLVWIDRNGRTSPASDEHKLFADPSLSPDGRSVALTIREARSSDVWVYNFDRSNFNRITSSPSLGYMPVWAPDSRRLFYIFEEPVFHIYSRAIGMIGEPERVLGGPFDLSPQSVPPDGRYLVYIQHDPSTRRGIWMLPLIGDRTPRVFIDTAAAETAAAISPDGKWLAYTSDQNGRDEIYVQAFPAGGQLSPVSSGGGTDPHWSRDGSELFFREGDKMMAAQMRGGTIARPTMLFEKRIVGFDVARDGRFIAVVPDPAAPPPSVNIVLNWFEELKRLVPER